MSDITLRLATEADLPAINDIYNHYVGFCTCTYQETPEPIEGRRAWFARHGEKHPVVVALIDDEIVGWGSLSTFHERSAFRFTVEDSIYVKESAQGRGVGRTLIYDLIDRAKQAGHRNIIALIDSLQTGSLTLHERAGFERVGHLKRVGIKFGKWLDMIYMQKPL